MPFPLRFPLAFDGKLLGQVLRIFTDTVARWYRQRQADRGLRGGQCGSVTAIHRASSDLRCDPHFHCLFLDGVYAPGRDCPACSRQPRQGPETAAKAANEPRTDATKVAPMRPDKVL